MSGYLYEEICVEDYWPFELDLALGVGSPNGKPYLFRSRFLHIVFSILLSLWRGVFRTVSPSSWIWLLGLGCLMGNPTHLEPDFFTLFYLSYYLYGEVFKDCWPFELDLALGVGSPDRQPYFFRTRFLHITFSLLLSLWRGFY